MGLQLHGQLTRVRPATPEDAELLVAWHADPEVARYWDGKTYTRAEILERLERGDVDAFVVEAGDEPVGYLQAWREEDEPLRGGLDMFLVPAARGRGLGPDAARTLARHLLDDGGWTRVTVDPYTWNEPAIRAWRRAGFRDVEERPADEEHKSAWLLMDFAG
jgi:aminoglycoside 6'-N-acetyltransferase